MLAFSQQSPAASAAVKPTERHPAWHLQLKSKLTRIAAIEADLFAKQMQPTVPAPDPDGDMAPPVPSGSAPLQFETNLAEAFERAQKALAALARHEAAARRAFDKALNNLWKLQGPRRRHDVERAAQAELEGFIAAYVNAPMPGSPDLFRPPDLSGYGPRPTSPAPRFDNSNPIPEPSRNGPFQAGVSGGLCERTVEPGAGEPPP